MKKKIIKKIQKKKYTIALLYHYVPEEDNGEYFSNEHSIADNQTDDIVKYMERLFRKRKFNVQIVRVMPDDLSPLQTLKADFVFNLVDSKAMEVKIAKILDRLHIPHSGSSFEAIKTSNNKIRSKKIFQKNKLPTPKYTLIQKKGRITKKLVPSKYPVIIKPAFEHCSIGISNNSIAKNFVQFKKIALKMRKKHDQTLIAEEFIPGRELQVTILETPDKTFALPIAEIAFKRKGRNKWNIYGFDEKWNTKADTFKSCYFIAPPKQIKDKIDASIKKDSIRAFYALGYHDYARFDLRFNPKEKQWYFLEGNANAGFDPDPRDAMTASVEAHGMTLDDFVLQIVNNSIN